MKISPALKAREAGWASIIGRRRHGMKLVPSLPPPHAGEAGGG